MKPILATCNESCKRTFELTEFLTDCLPDAVEKTYFLCPHCLHEYVAYCTDAEIRNLQERIRKVDRRIGKPHYDQKVANKMHAKLKGQIVEKMKQITVWKCNWCNNLFRTPNRHFCKKNPALKNCFTCKHLKGWNSDRAVCGDESPVPDCAAISIDEYDWNIEEIKRANYNMQCEQWEEGKYDWFADVGVIS